MIETHRANWNNIHGATCRTVVQLDRAEALIGLRLHEDGKGRIRVSVRVQGVLPYLMKQQP